MKKLKLLRSIISNAIKIKKNINTFSDILDESITIINTVKESKQKVKNKVKSVIKGSGKFRKIQKKINTIKTKKRKVLWLIDNKKKNISKHIDEMVASIPDYSELFFSLNFKNNKIDVKWRKLKLLFSIVATRGGLIKKISAINFRLYINHKINERVFITNFYLTSFFEIMHGNSQNVINDLIKMRLELNQKLYTKWYLYVYGRMYFYSLLKWGSEKNEIMNYILKLNHDIFFSFKDEVDDFFYHSNRWNTYPFMDLMFSNSLFPFLSIELDKSDDMLKIYAVLAKLKDVGEFISGEYIRFFQFIIINESFFIDFISRINEIIKTNNYFFYEYSLFKGGRVEEIMNNKIKDNMEYLIYSILFSIFVDEKFYIDLKRVKLYLHELGLKDSDSIIGELGKNIKNIRLNISDMTK